MIPVLPDTDALVTSALRAGLPGTTVRVLWPDDWSAHLPLVVARRVAGAATDPAGVDSAIIDVQCAAPTRREASLLARTARTVLLAACRAQHSGPDGHLSTGAEVSGPAELRTGAPAVGPDLSRFQATYRVTTRPHPKTL
ncbi:phage tail termination protein [Kitasatospora purpeofusca]|uniref:phage tail termination protein n=1 Tax=Kitasatospora purpeofusca TaxID=67352 RepID=UPI00381D3CC6